MFQNLTREGGGGAYLGDGASEDASGIKKILDMDTLLMCLWHFVCDCPYALGAV